MEKKKRTGDVRAVHLNPVLGETGEVAELFKQRPLDSFPEFDGVKPEGGPSELEEFFKWLPPEPETKEPEPETKEPEPETKQAAEALPMVEESTETAVLKCILTDAELRKCAEQMAKIMGDLSESQAELKSVAAQYKAVIARHEQQLGEEASKYRAGHEFRPVQLRVYFDYEAGQVWKVREDTGEKIEDRIMTPKEAQRKIWPEI